MKLSAEQPYADAAATVIRERARAVFAHRRKTVLDLGVGSPGTELEFAL